MSVIDVFLLLLVLFIKEFANCQEHPCGDNLSQVDLNRTVAGDGSEDVVFNCIISGVTLNTHTWYRYNPGMPLETIDNEDGKYQLVGDDKERLEIYDVTRGDEALYNCSIPGINGNNDRTNFCLTVVGYPAFLSCSEVVCEQNITAGSNVFIDVRFRNMFTGALNEIIGVGFVRITREVDNSQVILNTCNSAVCVEGTPPPDYPNVTFEVTSVTEDTIYTIIASYSDNQVVPSKSYFVTVNITTPILSTTSEITGISSSTSALLTSTPLNIPVSSLLPMSQSISTLETMTSISSSPMPSITPPVTAATNANPGIIVGVVVGVVVFSVLLLVLILGTVFLLRRHTRGKFSIFKPHGVNGGVIDAGTMMGANDEKEFPVLEESHNSVPRSI